MLRPYPGLFSELQGKRGRTSQQVSYMPVEYASQAFSTMSKEARKRITHSACRYFAFTHVGKEKNMFADKQIAAKHLVSFSACHPAPRCLPTLRIRLSEKVLSVRSGRSVLRYCTRYLVIQDCMPLYAVAHAVRCLNGPETTRKARRCLARFAQTDDDESPRKLSTQQKGGLQCDEVGKGPY